jgi:hypothetical protein
VSKEQSLGSLLKDKILRRLRKGSKCPMCEVGKLIPIVYGMPGRGLIEQSERGEIELGGCVMSPVLHPEIGLISGDPELSCPACEGRFFRARS